MILAIDTGNTNIELGVISDKKNDFTLYASGRFFTNHYTTSDELGIFVLNFLEKKSINYKKINKLVYSSVVPQLNDKICTFFKMYFNDNIIEVSYKTNLGVINKYKNPSEVGADRLVNAAYVNYLKPGNSIIVDMGTATTLCALTSTGEYLGGLIYPGMVTSLNSLISKAAKLTNISIVHRDKILADNTTEAIQSGLYFSNMFAIKGMIGRFAEELNFIEFKVVGTGGYSNIFKNDGIFDILEDQLTLKGLKVISDLN